MHITDIEQMSTVYSLTHMIDVTQCNEDPSPALIIGIMKERGVKDLIVFRSGRDDPFNIISLKEGVLSLCESQAWEDLRGSYDTLIIKDKDITYAIGQMKANPTWTWGCRKLIHHADRKLSIVLHLRMYLKGIRQYTLYMKLEEKYTHIYQGLILLMNRIIGVVKETGITIIIIIDAQGRDVRQLLTDFHNDPLVHIVKENDIYTITFASS